MTTEECISAVVRHIYKTTAVNGTSDYYWASLGSLQIGSGAVDDQLLQDTLVERNFLKPVDSGKYRITAALLQYVESAESQSAVRGVQYRYIPAIVEAIAAFDITPPPRASRTIIPPEEKLDWNKIRIARDWFDEHAPFYQTIESLLDQLDHQKRSKVRQTIRHFYGEERVLIASQQGLRPNDRSLLEFGDAILFKIHRRITDASMSASISRVSGVEDLESAVRSLVVYFAIKCDILERPEAK